MSRRYARHPARISASVGAVLMRSFLPGKRGEPDDGIPAAAGLPGVAAVVYPAGLLQLDPPGPGGGGVHGQGKGDLLVGGTAAALGAEVAQHGGAEGVRAGLNSVRGGRRGRAVPLGRRLLVVGEEFKLHGAVLRWRWGGS